jgi:hypothetical protein
MMKTRIQLAIATLSLFTLTACASIFQKSERIESGTNTVAVTDQVTNDAGEVVIVTNLVPVPYFVTNNVYTVSTQILAGAQMVRDTGNAISTVAPPAAPVVATVNSFLALGTTILGGLAAFMTQLSRKNKSKADKAALLLRAAVAGVEAANSLEVKQAIAKQSRVLGVAGALDEVVQNVTKAVRE